MAKGNMFLSQARGKVGSVVFSRQNGQQISRVHNPSPSNPQTIGQLYQRAIMATTAKAAAELRPIIDHSWQGVKYNSDSNAEFMRRNLDMLRAASVDQSSAVKVAIKGNTWAPLNNYVISAGTLDGPELSLIRGEYAAQQATWVQFKGYDPGATPVLDETPITNAEDYAKALMLLFGCTPGQQVTIVGLYEDNRRSAEFAGITQQRTTMRVDRICFKQPGAVDFAAAGTLLLTNVTGDNMCINPIFCDFTADEFGPRSTDTFTSLTGGGYIMPAADIATSDRNASGYAIRYGYNPRFNYALGIIISERVNGEWRRSDAQMLSTSDTRELEAIVPSYGKGEAEELGGNQWYLNQARSVRSGGTAYQPQEWRGGNDQGPGPYYNPLQLTVSRNGGSTKTIYIAPEDVDHVEWASDDMREKASISAVVGEGGGKVLTLVTEDNTDLPQDYKTTMSVVGYDANNVPFSNTLDLVITWN